RIEYFGRMIANRLNELAGESCEVAKGLKEILRNALGPLNLKPESAHFGLNIARQHAFPPLGNNLYIFARIVLPKNLRERSRSRNDRWFMRNDTSAGMQPFGDKKLGGYVAVAYVFFKGRNDRIVIVRVHGGAEAAPYV